MTNSNKYSQQMVEDLNQTISQFPHVFKIDGEMKKSFSGVSRMVMLDRYSQRDVKKETLKVGDLVVVIVTPDPKWPGKGIGFVTNINGQDITIKLDKEYEHLSETKEIVRKLDVVDKPLELYYEQIARRNATALASIETSEEKINEYLEKFEYQLSSLKLIPAGRVLYGAGSGTDVTYFNCFVMPFVKDSREGISDHRKQVMGIMSRGGGVGTNGSTLRPRNAMARGVNGFSSGAVTWLDDLSKLTNLVIQGGSRRGAQMIMLADSHADIIEFIISKMQNPKILRYILENFTDEKILDEASRKLKFTPLSETDKEMYEELLTSKNKNLVAKAKQLLNDGGKYDVNDPEFLSGANISVAVTKDLMDAIKNDQTYALRFPDVDNYTKEEMKDYDEKWSEVGDVRKWEEMGYAIKTYHTVQAKELWELINVCATYAAEPGIFYMDNANEMTNAQAYGQQVVATNPCGKVVCLT
jgi:ribonucleoside-diphosphate reductase alpha chain